MTNQPAFSGNGDANPRWGQRGTAGATIASRLTFEHVSHDYGAGNAVDDVSLEIEPGEIVCLLGQSGCGKTTLLRIAAGIEHQTGGRVLLDGQEIAGPRLHMPPEKRRIGLMFQDYALFPHMNILDNVCFGLKDLKKADAQRIALNVLRRVGLEQYAKLYPHALSGGEQQRVALARAIVPRPGVLLMDEPFSGLDQRLRTSVREETLDLLQETRATCIIVTHDPDEALQIADRIALMKSGRIVQVGAPKQMYSKPATLFASRFFSGQTEVEARVKTGKVETPLGVFPAKGFSDNEVIVVAIRPHAVKLNRTAVGIGGRISNVKFRGEADLVSIAIEGLAEPMQAKAPASFKGRVGDEVGIKIDPRQLLMFGLNRR